MRVIGDCIKGEDGSEERRLLGALLAKPKDSSSKVTLKIERYPAANITLEKAVLFMPATHDGVFRDRVRLNSKSRRKA